MTKQFYFKRFNFACHSIALSLDVKQFYLSHRTLLGTTIPDESVPGSDGKEEVLHIPQSSTITGASSSDCLMSYPGHLSLRSYPSAEMQSVYFTAPAIGIIETI